jgi:hypothetical protein
VDVQHRLELLVGHPVEHSCRDLRVDVVDQHLRAVLDEKSRRREPDAPAGSRDQGDLPFQDPHPVSSPLSLAPHSARRARLASLFGR